MEAGVCCGSAGIYNLVQPEEAAELGTIKADDLSNTGAALVASANIGCTLQLRRHLQGRQPVHHPMELLSGISRLASVAKPQTGCCRCRDCRGR